VIRAWISRLGRAYPWARALALPAAALAVCLVVPTGLVRHDYLRTVLWGGAILASAVGWGRLASRHLFGKEARPGWGLEAALGMAVHLMLGGLLAMLSLVSAKTIYGAVAIGVALFAVEAWRRVLTEVAEAGSSRRAAPANLADAALVVLFFGIAIVHYLGMAAERPGNIWDDYEAYYSFPKQLLATGTLIEPFSPRRIASFGGQPYLQAVVLAFSTVFRVGVLDNGICFIVIGALAIGWVRERPHLPTAVAAPALIGLVTLPYRPHNAASELSGAVFFAAIFRILDRPRRADEGPAGNALALALAVFSTCTLRQSNLAAAGMIPAAYYLYRIAREPEARRRWAQEAALAALFTGALLLPWMVLAYRSSGTLLYPLALGNGVGDFGAFEPITALEKARFVVMASLYPGHIPGLLLVLAAGLLVPGRTSLALRASLAGTGLAILMLFNIFASADEVDSTHRFLFPYALGYFVSVSVVTAGAVAYRTTMRGGSVIAAALVACALMLQLSQGRDTLVAVYLADVDSIAVESARPARFGDAAGADARYTALQQAVPEHETLLVMLDQPFRLDFKRNRIFSWDQPGGSSPKPHLPIGRGPEAVAQYLLDHGVRYVAYFYGASPEYNNSWEGRLKGPAPARDGKSRGAQLRAMARYYVDIFANLRQLTTSRKQLYADNGAYVLDLATPSEAEPAPPAR
jgi:hypothetical protein